MAKSPTIFDEGVTLGMSPTSRFTTANAYFTSFQRGSSPISATCGPEVRVLAAGNLVEVHLGGAALQPALERAVHLAHVLPVVGERLQLLVGQLRVARVAALGRHQRVQRRLAGEPGHRRQRAVHDVHAVIDRLEVGGDAVARGVVGVEVDRQPDRLAQPIEQHPRGARPEQPGHVLDAEEVRAHVLDAARQVGVVVEVVLGALLVRDVARVAHGHLGDLPGLPDAADADLHRFEVVQRVEDPEHVHARLRRLVDERLDQVVRVAGVPDRVRAPDQHLEQEVGHRRAQRPEPRPGVLVQEPVRGVERGTAPALEAEQLGREPGGGRGDLQDVVGPHPRRQQTLVRVAHRGVGHQGAVLLEHPGGEPLGAALLEDLPGPRQAAAREATGGSRGSSELHRAPALLGLDGGVAVDDHLAQVLQQLGRAVSPPLRAEELGRVVDPAGEGLALAEGLACPARSPGTRGWSSPRGSGTRGARAGPSGWPPRSSGRRR